MPYHFEKGPVLSVLENFLNGDQARAGSVLDGLRAGTALYSLGFLDSGAVQNPGDPVPLKDHVYQDWFGWAKDAAGAWQPRAPGANTPTTGYWTAYSGDVEHIVRCAVTRALEVSLGVPHVEPRHSSHPGSVPPCVPTRHWPIDILWKCAQAWFEGWVTWRATAGGGHVQLVLATPASGTPLLSDLRKGLPGYANPVGDGPNGNGSGSPTRTQGMWVVSHPNNVSTKHYVVTDSPSEDWSGWAIMPVITGTGDVVTWQLAEADGGVLPDGRNYT